VEHVHPGAEGPGQLDGVLPRALGRLSQIVRDENSLGGDHVRRHGKRYATAADGTRRRLNGPASGGGARDFPSTANYFTVRLCLSSE
jgi:hypothetical protein